MKDVVKCTKEIVVAGLEVDRQKLEKPISEKKLEYYKKLMNLSDSELDSVLEKQNYSCSATLTKLIPGESIVITYPQSHFEFIVKLEKYPTTFPEDFLIKAAKRVAMNGNMIRIFSEYGYKEFDEVSKIMLGDFETAKGISKTMGMIPGMPKLDLKDKSQVLKVAIKRKY